MVKNLKKPSIDGDNNFWVNILRKNIFKNILRNILRKNVKKLEIENFITSKTWNFFLMYESNIDKVFLSISIKILHNGMKTWYYKNVLQKIKTLKVTNNIPERAISFAENFNEQIINNKEQFQILFQSVKYNHQIFPACSKQNGVNVGTIRKV